MTHVQTVAALRLASLVVSGVGALTVATLLSPQAPLLARFLELALLDFGGEAGVVNEETRLLGAVMGGLMAGWGVTNRLIATHVYARDPGLGGRILLQGMLVWFVVDGVGSALAGAWFNIVLNVPFLALFAVPILRARRAGSAASAG